MGKIAQEQRDFTQAEQWYRKSLEISEERRIEYWVVITSRELGGIAQERRDFTQAEHWYRKSLKFSENMGNKHETALTCWRLGGLSALIQDYLSSGTWFLKAVIGFTSTGDERSVQLMIHNFFMIFQLAAPSIQTQLRQSLQDAGLDNLVNLAQLEAKFNATESPPI